MGCKFESYMRSQILSITNERPLFAEWLLTFVTADSGTAAGPEDDPKEVLGRALIGPAKAKYLENIKVELWPDF